MPKCYVCERTHSGDMTSCPTDNKCQHFMPDKNNPDRKGWACRLAKQSGRCRDYCELKEYLRSMKDVCRWT